MASAEIELARKQALSDRRIAGHNAWSPSRAREAMRKALAPPVPANGHPDPTHVSIAALRQVERYVHTAEAFNAWCSPRFGFTVPEYDDTPVW